MIFSIVTAVITSAALITVVLFKPQIKIFNVNLSLYAYIPLIGGIILIAFGGLNFSTLIEKFTSTSSANPIKIIVLFISMSLISVLLDETGFFEYVAEKIAQNAGKSQIRIFVAVYLTVSVLTVFTSNDVVILTFTPFICQFCKKAEIDPIPYVVSEFVAANTWSLLFLIGNPTNVFLSQSYGIDFLTYFKVMWLPTVFCGLSSFITLYLLFRKKLKKPVYRSINEVKLKDKTTAVITLTFLICCTVLISVSSYLNIEMWLVALITTAVLYLTIAVIKLITKRKDGLIKESFKRAPWQMVPLVLGMFVIITGLVECGATKLIANLVGESLPILKYGVLSTLFSNVINNIPMSLLFSSVAAEIPNAGVRLQAVYATVIGSNVGAFLTPLGALAGLMFTSIVKKHYSDFGFKKFLKYGAVVATISLVFGLIGLYLSFLLV